jgi:hypothetical protein
MNIFQVSTKVSTLCKRFEACGTLERTLACVFSEVISKITTFLESALAALEAALEE